ncbi:DUF1761 domain-containing protein [uncultured Boseongicola sp.]|jgi:hypothetical protein|uniref:DUF1761 domain-containing protein n=1 Tax=uncultured Boseongicola sp. TaxID=1648499 RepID=UPI00260FC696|nr:DUF1761 domain-containing protein [uncultured Boseongicola sp.]
MGELTTNVSWIAVIVGAIASFLLGWLWYSERLFGEKWAVGVGVELAKVHANVGALAAQIVGLFLMSWFVSVAAASNLLLTVILATLAFVILAQSGAMFRGQSTYARLVDAGHWIASLVIMIVANAIF